MKMILNKLIFYLTKVNNYDQQDKFNLAILETLKQYVYVFKENKILEKKRFWKTINYFRGIPKVLS